MGPDLSGGHHVKNDLAPLFVDVPYSRFPIISRFDRASKIHDLTIAEGDLLKADLRFLTDLWTTSPVIASAPLLWHTISGATAEPSK
jgi:hypothetical protein